MHRIPLFLFVIVVALATIACGFTINLPVDNIVTGDTQVKDINIPVPEDLPAEVTIKFGAGELSLEPGASDALIAGTALYNVKQFEPEIYYSGSEVRLTTGNVEIGGLPRINLDDLQNEWDLKLANVPMSLDIQAGAYQGKLELGGLSLESLEISDGAADVSVSFSALNNVDMRELKYSTGASSVDLSGLANANFSKMVFRGGAGDYTLDFSGQLQRDAFVEIDAGVSQVTIVVPEGTSARVVFAGGVSNISPHGNWTMDGKDYVVAGDGPTLTINVTMGAGNLELKTR